MRFEVRILFSACLWLAVGVSATTVEYNFNTYSDGPVDGQFDWNIYNKVKDSSGLSIVDGVGRSDKEGDKALVVNFSEDEFRGVSADPVRWMPGETLTVEFDLKVAVPEEPLTKATPVLTVFIGNNAMTEKSRWEVRLEAVTGGDWRLIGGMPDNALRAIYAEKFMIRPNGEVAISDWFRFVMVVEKLSESDSFKSRVQILDTADVVVGEITFTDQTKDKRTKSMWNLSRLHVGFNVSDNQYGLAVIDNLKVTTK